MEVPSMVRRSGGKRTVRQAAANGEQQQQQQQHQLAVLHECIKTEQHPNDRSPSLIDGDSQGSDNATHPGDSEPHAHQPARQPGRPSLLLLPQCKIKRNYTCRSCHYFTQNPRNYLTHLRDTHGEKVSVYECKRCLYASRHHQKLARHMRMVHGAVTVSSKTTTPANSNRERGEFVEPECPKPERLRRDRYPSGTLETQILDALGNVHAQQLVASLLSSIEPFWSSSLSAIKSEMDDLQSVMKSSEQNQNQDRMMEKNVRKSSEDNESTPRKRARPIPNLIPLAPSTPVPTRPEKELLKPVPMSVLMPSDVTQKVSDQPTSSPVRLSSPQTKCTFCELSFESTIDLANHIATSHKEDLITSLLQKSIDESNQNLFPQSDADSASNEMWKSLLEVNMFSADPGPRAASEPDGKSSSNASKADDDEVELVENKSETYCGVETAPGYGEVTSKLTATDPNATGLMKKVFKCPHCSFWASTASRFHVHIVGHLNKKPFECSLCSYRSNWRWDITKHIRLKTIRDPSHKNAGVLMNDETGRRNYTKYNKYITLMQITDHSASKESTSYAKTLAESSMSDLMSAYTAFNIDLKALANIPEFNLLLEDKQLNDDPIAVGLRMDDNGHFKCQYCEHRTTTKEELLLHIASGHTSALGTSALQQLEDAIEQEASQKSQKTSTANSISTPSSTPTPPTAAAGLCSLSKSAANTSNDSPTNGTLLTTASGAGDKANAPEPTDRGGGGGGDSRAGEGESSTQRVAMPTTWRHNAPYRCGHCHQVSNWKHVIQRHCRLKHNGHVFIEHVSSEKDDPSDGESQQQQQQHQQQQRNSKQNQHSVYVIEDVLHHQATVPAGEPTTLLASSSIPPPLAPFSMDDVGCPANTLEPIVEILDKDPADMINFNGSLMPSTVLVDSGTVAPVAVPSEQLECISCQFRAESVEQLTEHLEQHMCNSQGGSGTGHYDPSGLLDPVPTTMYYCPRCPARFFHESHMMEHEAKHAAGSEGKPCSVCTYTTTDDDERGRHEEVHSAAYNINTDNLQIFLAESKEYPKPQLMLKECNGEQLFYVDVPVGNGPTHTPDVTSSRKSKKSSKPRVRTPESANGDEPSPLSSIFLCEYCDQTFDVEPDLNAHVRTHFSSILSPQGVSYYTSLSNTLDKEKKLELIVSGSQSAMALHYVYDNARRKDWNVYSKAESVLLKF